MGHGLAAHDLPSQTPGACGATSNDGAPDTLASTSQGKNSGLYVKPEPVSIQGYGGSAMEPFISPDGRYLFFNNENNPTVDTNLHFAERTGKFSFRYLGPLPGVNSSALDAVPSIDKTGHFYFTSLRDYSHTLNLLYTGDFDGARVNDVRPLPGDITPAAPGIINMDANVSPDGRTLYISRAVFAKGTTAPTKSEIMIARLTDGAFRIDPDSGRILRNVNTGELQYAASISADDLELYFTRAIVAGPDAGAHIMVATRRSRSEPFGEPEQLSQLSGFVEAPSVSLDGKELFFHKRVGSKFVIYRAERSKPAQY
ncbi:MAG TPA: hypothetical protein VI756_23320 [Blastocatellia bacterium]